MNTVIVAALLSCWIVKFTCYSKEYVTTVLSYFTSYVMYTRHMLNIMDDNCGLQESIWPAPQVLNEVVVALLSSWIIKFTHCLKESLQLCLTLQVISSMQAVC